MSDRLKVFISYSRRDTSFAETLVSALEANNFDVLIDRRDLPYGEEWQSELGEFIRNCDTVVWLVSTDSIASKWCNWELGEVGRLNKRLVPVRVRDIDPLTLPESLGKIHLLPADGVYQQDLHLGDLVETLQSDRGWLKEATRLADRARQWLGKNRDTALLLRGAALQDAEVWTQRQPRNAPLPPSEVLDLILSSRRGQRRRQTWLVGSSLTVAVAGIALASIAFLFQQKAESNAAVARDQRDTALTTQSRFLADLARQRIESAEPATAVLLALEALGDVTRQERPYAPEAEAKLYAALQKIRGTQIFRAEGSDVGNVQFVDADLIAYNSDKHVRVLDRRTGRQGPPAGAGDVPGYLIRHDRPAYLATEGDKRMLWSLPGGELLASFKGGAPHVSPDGRRVVTIDHMEGEGKPRLLLWSSSGEKLSELAGHLVGPTKERSRRLIGNRGTSLDSTSYEFSPDGQQIVTTNGDTTARLWSASNGEALGVLKGHNLEVLGASFSPDGRMVATASIDRTALVWDAETRQPICEIKDESELLNATFSRSGATLLTYANGQGKLWDPKTCRQIVALRGSQGLYDVAFSPAGKYVFGTNRFDLGIFDATTGRQVRVWTRDYSYMRAVFSRDDEFVLILPDNGPAEVYRLASGATPSAQLVLELKGLSSKVTSASFSPDGKTLATMEKGGDIRLWELAPRWNVTLLDEHLAETDSPIERVAFVGNDASRVLTVPGCCAVMLWDATTGRRLKVYKRKGEIVQHARLHPAGATFLGVSRASVATGKGLEAGTHAKAEEVSALLHGKALSAASVVIWDSSDGKELRSFTAEGNHVVTAEFSRDGTLIAAGTEEGNVYVWRTEDSVKPIAVLKGHTGTVWGVEFAPDDRSLLTSSRDKTVRLWDLASSAQRHAFDDSAWGRMNPDGKIIVTSGDKGMAIRDAETGQRLRDILEKGRAVFSADGGKALIFSERRATIWDLRSMAMTVELVGVSGLVGEAAFNADATRVAVAMSDTTARIWDVQTGKAVAVLGSELPPFVQDRELREAKRRAPTEGGHVTWVRSLAFSRDGSRIVTGAGHPEGWRAPRGNTAIVWPIFRSTREIVDYARALVPQCLTRDQRTSAFLDPEPPFWCIEQSKWPYDSPEWRAWLVEKKSGQNPALPRVEVRQHD